MVKSEICWEDFQKIDFRSGTIVAAKINPKARVPAYILKVDVGELGIKTSSAQLTGNYSAEDLVGKQVLTVVNFPSKRIAGVKSELLVTGIMDVDKGTVLVSPSIDVTNGMPLG